MPGGGVRKHGGGAPRRGDHAHGPPLRQLCSGHQVGGLKKFFQVVGLEDSGPPAGRIKNAGRPGQGPCVRQGGLLSGLGFSNLQEDNRFSGPAKVFQRQEKFPPVPNGFHQAHDHAGMFVPGEKLEELRYVQIGLIPRGDRMGEPHAIVGRAVGQRRKQGPALRDESHGPRGQVSILEGGRERQDGPAVEVDRPEGVRAEDAHAASIGDGRHLILEDPTLPSAFGKPAADDDSGFRLPKGKGLQDRDHPVGGEEDDGAIDPLGQIVDAGKAGDPVHVLVFRIDCIDPTWKSMKPEIVEGLARNPGRICGRADQGHRFRP